MRAKTFSAGTLEAIPEHQTYMQLCSAVGSAASDYLIRHVGLRRILGQAYAHHSLNALYEVASISSSRELSLEQPTQTLMAQLLDPSNAIESIIGATVLAKSSLPFLIDAFILQRQFVAFEQDSFATMFIKRANRLLNMNIHLTLEDGKLSLEVIKRFRINLTVILGKMASAFREHENTLASPAYRYFLQLRKSMASAVENYLNGTGAVDESYHGSKGKYVARSLLIRIWQINNPKNEMELKEAVDILLKLLDHFLINRQVGAIEGRIPTGRLSLATLIMQSILQDAEKLPNARGPGTHELGAFHLRFSSQRRGWHLFASEELSPDTPKRFMQLLYQSARQFFPELGMPKRSRFDGDVGGSGRINGSVPYGHGISRIHEEDGEGDSKTSRPF